MEKSELLKMFKAEITDKVDAETLEKLKNSKTKKEALSILEGLSINLDDEMLSAVAGGDGIAFLFKQKPYELSDIVVIVHDHDRLSVCHNCLRII